MKSKIRNSIIVVLLIVLIRQNGSYKGHWSEIDKKEFQKDLNNETDFILKLGNNKEVFFECITNKLEQNYSSYNEANKDEIGYEKIMNECLFNAFSNGSVIGNWSESDKQRVRDEMGTESELSNLGNNKSKFIECCLSKCEEEFSSYFEANTNKKECEKLALYCRNEIISGIIYNVANDII